MLSEVMSERRTWFFIYNKHYPGTEAGNPEELNFDTSLITLFICKVKAEMNIVCTHIHVRSNTITLMTSNKTEKPPWNGQLKSTFEL